MESSKTAMLWLLKSYSSGWQDIGDRIHWQNLACRQWEVESQQTGSNPQPYFVQVATEEQTKGPTNLAPKTAPLHQGFYKRGEVIVDNYHVGRLACHLCS